jgi:hypothetical protein
MSRRKAQGGGPGPAPGANQDGAAPARLRIARPSDLLGVVPYLLGFHPQESLVVAVLGADRVQMTARLDVAELGRPREVAGYLRSILASQQGSGFVTLTYSRRPDAREITTQLLEQLGADLLVDALLVDDERWWSLLCDGSCCPPEGTAYDLRSHPLSAAAVYAGLSALPDRQALAAAVCGPAAEQLAELEALVLEAADGIAGLRLTGRMKLVRRLVRAQIGGGGTLGRIECVRLALLVSSVHVRDVAWAQLSRERAEAHVDLWRQVVAQSPDYLAAAPLCLLGMSAWVAGQGALQNCCVERALELDPQYSMAWLLSDINRRCLPPSYWDQLSREFRRERALMAG